MGLEQPGTGVVVTGGASGIGRAICLALGEVGRPVSPWDVDLSGSEQTAKECSERFGVTVHPLEVDVRDRSAIADAVSSTVDALGTVGGLAHSAGIVRPSLDNVVDLDTWDDVLVVNLRAEADIVAALMPAFRAAGPGSAVVGISSIEGLVGHGAIPSYCASKAGLLGLTRSLADRLGPEGIRVNAVCPGYIQTPMSAPILAEEASRQRFASTAPLGRVGQPEDIARVVRFLLSEEAGYVHGTAVVVDGGTTAVGGQPH